MTSSSQPLVSDSSRHAKLTTGPNTSKCLCPWQNGQNGKMGTLIDKLTNSPCFPGATCRWMDKIRPFPMTSVYQLSICQSTSPISQFRISQFRVPNSPILPILNSSYSVPFPICGCLRRGWLCWRKTVSEGRQIHERPFLSSP